MFLESKLVKLTPPNVDDTNDFYKWSGDREATQFSFFSYSYPQSKAEITHWFSGIKHSKSTVTFGICCSETRALIGCAGIASMRRLNRSGEYCISIGEKSYWGKGLGTDVTKFITDYGFNTLGLHRIDLTAFSSNDAAIKAYEKARYVDDGVKRESGYRNGKHLDKVQMSVLSHEWQGI